MREGCPEFIGINSRLGAQHGSEANPVAARLEGTRQKKRKTTNISSKWEILKIDTMTELQRIFLGFVAIKSFR